MISDKVINEEQKLHFSAQSSARFDIQQKAMWVHLRPQPRPCFNLEILNDIRAYGNFLSSSSGSILHDGKKFPIKYSILVSDIPNIFNLGGDLELFIHLIQEKNHQGLIHYGKTCVKVLYDNYIAYDLPLTTISLVQGLCLGGGFEAALCSDILIAEQSSRFGFPEIAFNLFPGMGAYSFLTRRLDQRLANELITSGKRYTAHELFDLGLVDFVVADGEGRNAVKDLIAKRERSQNAFEGLAQVRRLTQKIDYQELVSVVEIWANQALNLTNRDLRLMERFMRGQNFG